MYKYYVFLCADEECRCKFEEMHDDKQLPETAVCPDCGKEASRVPYFGILKGEIEEKTHGGRLHNGKLLRKYTGFDDIREERKLEKQMRHLQKNGKATEAIEAAKELGKKRNENTAKTLK